MPGTESLSPLHNNQIIARPTENRNRLINDTSFAEQFCWDIMAGLSGGVTYGQPELRQLFESYHPAFFGKESELPPNNNILTAKATYVLPRLVTKEHIPLLADADIHFTDNARDFYKPINGGKVETFIPDKRARVYRIDSDENGRVHITYLLRHSVTDNYIDAFELISFLAFTEFYKKQILVSNFDFKGEEGKKLEKNLRTLGFDKNGIIQWAGRQNFGQDEGLFLLPSEHFSLNAPWQINGELSVTREGEISEHDGNVVQDAVWMIKKNVEKFDGMMPDHVIMGNDFSIPLMATLGLFDNYDIERVFGLASLDNLNPEKQTLNKAEIEREIDKIPKEIDKKTIRKFRVYQYLNLYTGNNPELLQMKRLLDSKVNGIRDRIIIAGATGLGCPVDIIDFSHLPEGLISRIEHPRIRKIITNLYEKKARVLSLPYPLGENIEPLIRLFHRELGINNIGFLGKVGSVIDMERRGVKRGRVVIPEYYTRVGETGEAIFRKFRNHLNPKDAILVPEADGTEVIMSTNSVLLQTSQDISICMAKAKRTEKNPRILLDSESYYLQKICEDLNIDPSIVYYVSDNTNIDGSLDMDMTKALEAQGTLAALESPLIILNKWFAD